RKSFGFSWPARSLEPCSGRLCRIAVHADRVRVRSFTGCEINHLAAKPPYRLLDRIFQPTFAGFPPSYLRPRVTNCRSRRGRRSPSDQTRWSHKKLNAHPGPHHHLAFLRTAASAAFALSTI